jgi:hypothetical protein
LQIGGHLLGPLKQLHDLSQIGFELACRCGGADASADSLDEANTEVLFEAPQVFRDCGLADVLFGGSSNDAAFIKNGEKQTQTVKS